MRIEDEIVYNLEFTLPRITGCLNLSVSQEALGTDYSWGASAELTKPSEALSHSRIQKAASRTRVERIPWTPKEDVILRNIKKRGCSWEKIHRGLPSRSKGTIQVRF
jgi:hypothetical protein